ncbi:MAG: hypothetical protein HY984_00450 [Candidatus Magasanikbacteria bacterium]|nr:hypothetical protein [Candidatus Magasanikbacteria bacterium]
MPGRRGSRGDTPPSDRTEKQKKTKEARERQITQPDHLVTPVDRPEITLDEADQEAPPREERTVRASSLAGGAVPDASVFEEQPGEGTAAEPRLQSKTRILKAPDAAATVHNLPQPPLDDMPTVAGNMSTEIAAENVTVGDDTDADRTAINLPKPTIEPDRTLPRHTSIRQPPRARGVTRSPASIKEIAPPRGPSEWEKATARTASALKKGEVRKKEPAAKITPPDETRSDVQTGTNIPKHEDENPTVMGGGIIIDQELYPTLPRVPTLNKRTESEEILVRPVLEDELKEKTVPPSDDVDDTLKRTSQPPTTSPLKRINEAFARAWKKVFGGK